MATVSGLSVCKECSCVLEEKAIREGKCPECKSAIRAPREVFSSSLDFQNPVPFDLQRLRKIAVLDGLPIEPCEKEERIDAVNREYMAIMGRITEEYILEWMKESHLLMKMCLSRSRDLNTLREIVAHAKQIGKIAQAIEMYKEATGKGRGEEV